MEFELNRYDLYDLQIDLDQKLFVTCEPDPEYSPREGLTNAFFWFVELQLADGTLKDITDELTEDDQEIIAKQVEEFFHD
jgi:hypothetical protein